MRSKTTVVGKNVFTQLPKGMEKDIHSISEWMEFPLENLVFTKHNIKIECFEKQILEMIDSYEEFPEDKKRTYRIIELIKNGNKKWPIFIKNNDPSLFIMEGKHRIVAFYKLGIEKVPIIWVNTINCT